MSVKGSSDFFFRSHPATRRNKASPELKHLLGAMMNPEPSLRPSIQDILNSEWMRNSKRE
jgi:hypothetical protein